MKKIFPYFFWLIFIFLAIDDSKLRASPGGFHIRVRENYEHLELSLSHQKYRYQSFSHTFNLWFEKPYDYAFGLATGPFVMSYSKSPQQKIPDQHEFGEYIKFISHGLELKKWYLKNYFFRMGTYFHQFNSNGTLGKDWGLGGLFGLGYELDFENIGLAFEADYKLSKLSRSSVEISSKMVAIGFHFYKYI
ncbi:MAG: hypothetical protein AB8G05_17595 [Oligoflexales bacterium]